MVLESYFDDSSDSRRSNLYACGGLLGGPDQWDRFDILWNNETHALKEPFRSADCEGGYGQFRDWLKPERDALMARLVSVICKIRLSGFASIVPVAEYKKAFPHCKERDPFLLSLRQVVMNMAAIAGVLKNQVTLWFERGSVDGAIRATFESIAEFKSWPPARWLKGINFGTKTLRPLQSADLVAREAFKHIANLGVKPMRLPVQRMRDNLYFTLWNKIALEYLAHNGGPENLELLSSWDARPEAPRLSRYIYKPHVGYIPG